MLKLKQVIIFMCFICTTINADELNEDISIIELQEQITSYKDEINHYKTEIITLKEDIKKSQNEIEALKSNYLMNKNINESRYKVFDENINLVSLNITIFTYLFTFLAIILGLYITFTSQKMYKNKKIISLIKKEIIDTKEIIENDIESMFDRFLRYDIDKTLDRIILVPGDIENFTSKLLTSELIPEDYIKLKESFLKIPKSKRTNIEREFALQFYQHFLGKTVVDKKLDIDLTKYFKEFIDASFDCDIHKCINDLLSCVIKVGIKKYDKVLISYFSALRLSKEHNSEKDYYRTCYQSLKTNNNRLKFLKILLDVSQLKTVADHYIDILKENKVNFDKAMNS